MTVIDLSEKLAKFIAEGKGDYSVSVEGFEVKGDDCFYVDDKHKDINIG